MRDPHQVTNRDPDQVTNEELARALIASSEGVIVTDAAQNIVFANDAVTALTGYSETEMLGRNCRLLQGPRTDPQTLGHLHDDLLAGRTFRGTLVNYTKDGHQFWNELTISPVLDAAGKLSHFVSVQRDVSELIELRESLRVQVRREKLNADTAQLLLKVARLLSDYSSVMDVADAIAEGILDVCAADRSAVALWDPVAGHLRMVAQSGWPEHLAGKIAEFSVLASDLPELATIVATGESLLVGPSPSKAMQLLLEEYELSSFVAMPISSRGELRGLLLAYWDGANSPSEIGGTLEERLDGLGNLAAVSLENATLMERAVWNGTHDTLTALSDRALFEQSLDRALTSGLTASTTVAVLYIDIDQFKRMNDTLGHPAGDSVLRHVASVLLAATRDSDVVARMGGDEFVVLLSNLRTKRTAEQVLSRIQAKLESPLRIGVQDVFVSLSIGIAFSDEVDGALPVTARSRALIAAADTAMYEEKAARVGVPAKSVHPRELTIDTALHGAVARGEVTVAFQPQLDVDTQEITAVEALARWENSELGPVSPLEFIPVAETNGLIGELGAEILRQACALGRELMVQGRPLNVAVNASVRELMDDDFLERVSTIIAESGFPPERVTFEMTETQLAADIPELITRLQGLRELGAGVSLDDFGTGNTSLMQLYDLPLTELKIDQAFIARDGPVGEALIRGIIAIAHQIGVTVVTEGVETSGQYDVVTTLGSDRMQGYHIARPMSRPDFVDWLNRGDGSEGGSARRH